MKERNKHAESSQHAMTERLRVLETRKMTDMLKHAVRRKGRVRGGGGVIRRAK